MALKRVIDTQSLLLNDAAMSRRVWRGCYEALGVSLSKTAPGADPRGSCKYSIESFEDRSGEGLHVNNSGGQSIAAGIVFPFPFVSSGVPGAWLPLSLLSFSPRLTGSVMSLPFHAGSSVNRGRSRSKASKSEDPIQALTQALAAKDEMIAALTKQVAMLNDQIGKLLSQVAALTGGGPNVEKDKGKTKDGNTKVPDAFPPKPNLSRDEGWATVKSSKVRKMWERNGLL